MGALCATGDEKDREITSYMSGAQNDDSRVFKLLLLGAGATGKSTLFKSLQIIHSGSIQASEKKSIIHFIRQNILNGICTLLEQSNILYELDSDLYSECQPSEELSDDEKKHIEIVLEFKGKTGFVDETKLDYDELHELAESIKVIWNLEFIQATYKNRGGNFVFDDNLDYFFSNVTEIMSSDYMPSDDDILKNRIKTSGMIQYEYSAEKSANKYAIIDVGGQRAERSKWVKCFDNVHGLLFVAGLTDYNTMLYEDNKTNGMRESVELFAETTKNQIFKNCALILILNKDDLLQKLLESDDNGLARCFSKKGKWPNEDEYWDTQIDEKYKSNEIDFDIYHNTVVDFISHLFAKRNGLSGRMYQHVTIATQNSIVKQVFHDIQTIMVKNAMKQSGYWTEAE